MSDSLSPEQVVAILQRQGYLDDEVVEHFAGAGQGIGVDAAGRLKWARRDPSTGYQKRILREWLSRQQMDGPTNLARRKIPEIESVYPVMRRTAKNGLVSKKRLF